MVFCCLLAFFFHARMNIEANYFKLTFLGLSDMNKVIEIAPHINEEVLHYARVSKISTDSFDSTSTSSGEFYENTTRHDLVTPGLFFSSHSAYICFFIVTIKMLEIYHINLRLLSDMIEPGPSQSSVISDHLGPYSRGQPQSSGKFLYLC